MSAHKLFCFRLQRRPVLDFLDDVNPFFNTRLLHSIDTADELRGHPHVTFLCTGRLPPRMREVLNEIGAVVIHIDGSRERLLVASP